jgi:hypothetical protein
MLKQRPKEEKVQAQIQREQKALAQIKNLSLHPNLLLLTWSKSNKEGEGRVLKALSQKNVKFEL